jgi:AICAR transformylase/IMP cyclohydrolase PurH
VATVGVDIADAYAKAHACDPVSAFGGVVAANRTVTVAMAEPLSQIFTEVIIAPEYEPAALKILMKKPSIRILLVNAIYFSTRNSSSFWREYWCSKQISSTLKVMIQRIGNKSRVRLFPPL